MSLEIGLLFAVLVAMVYLFLTEKLPIDLTAFLGLVFLLLAGYVGPKEAFLGFSSTAVITMLSSLCAVSAAITASRQSTTALSTQCSSSRTFPGQL